MPPNFPDCLSDTVTLQIDICVLGQNALTRVTYLGTLHSPSPRPDTPSFSTGADLEQALNTYYEIREYPTSALSSLLRYPLHGSNASGKKRQKTPWLDSPLSLPWRAPRQPGLFPIQARQSIRLPLPRWWDEPWFPRSRLAMTRRQDTITYLSISGQVV